VLQELMQSVLVEHAAPSDSRQEPAEQVRPALQALPQDPQLLVLLDRETQAPLHPVSPLAQHVPPVQLLLVHWVLFWQEVPLACWELHAPLPQYLPAPHGVVAAAVHEPVPSQTEAVMSVVELLQLAAVQTVSLLA
jgi:hypothetical protein